ncbi:unnamed protein product [Kuraishia capsulata CBS 1993]|uniref:triacylglycerol lipase n=1 Tax=Kuraishia capsulata CBS 1993 TaxID=1382522 RepID=W6MVH2_9ASCO|nr:uncharacterized protein KUCA_T00002251001 [Kuraishia capsulata CBS 1993]CDK26280.1 unnamed protein product [Kuraishia capsulata CBS 1993]
MLVSLRFYDILAFITLLLLSRATGSLQEFDSSKNQLVLGNAQDSSASGISERLHQQFRTYADLVDISYCITSLTSIKKPFKCNVGCDKFPNTTVVYQWTTDSDAILDHSMLVSGYIAVDNLTRSIYVSLRGTKSFTDTLSDIEITQMTFANPGNHLSKCVNCKVHAGFYMTYRNTVGRIDPVLSDLIKLYPAYQVLFLGHSLGGAVAMLLPIHLIETQGFKNFRVVTYGQPIVGNEAFADWYEKSLDANGLLDSRLFYRITNIGDQIPTLPRSQISTPIIYEQVSGEIFLSQIETDIPKEAVWVCNGRSDRHCLKNSYFSADAHLIYYKKIGTCIPNINND